MSGATAIVFATVAGKFGSSDKAVRAAESGSSLIDGSDVLLDAIFCHRDCRWELHRVRWIKLVFFSKTGLTQGQAR